MFNNIKVTEGDYYITNKNMKLAIVASKFNSMVVDNLIKGAISTLNLHGIQNSNIELIFVPGAIELPLAVKNVINNPAIDGVIALGAVIRGETPHFDYVAGECISGLSRLSLEYNKPIACGVLTTNTLEQAIDRSGAKAGNKGSEAAMVLISMVNLICKLKAEQ